MSDIITNGCKIVLNQNPIRIDDVIVAGNRKKTRKIGISSAATRMISTPLFTKKEIGDNSIIGREIGTAIKIKDSSILKSLHFYITRNNYDNIKLRVLFYKIEDKQVKDLIVNKDIVVDIKDRSRVWVDIDIFSYGINLDGNQEVLVSLMTLDNITRHEFWINGMTLNNNGLYRRDNALGEWERSSGGISLYLKVLTDK